MYFLKLKRGAFLFFMVCASFPFAFASETFTIRYAEGENTLLRPGLAERQRLQTGDTVHLGDRIVCSEGGLLQVEGVYGVFEFTDGADLLIRSLSSSQKTVTFELVAGQMKGDWSSGTGFPLTVHVPGGEFQVENGFFSLWIYSLLGRPYTRVDLFRGEGFLQETSGSVPFFMRAGQHMTTGLPGGQGPREAPRIPGFDTFEINPSTRQTSSKAGSGKTNAALQTGRA